MKDSEWKRGPAKAGLLTELCQRLTVSLDIRGVFYPPKSFNYKAYSCSFIQASALKDGKMS